MDKTRVRFPPSPPIKKGPVWDLFYAIYKNLYYFAKFCLNMSKYFLTISAAIPLVALPPEELVF